MIRWQIIKTLWGKELLETCRDIRTLVVMLLLPVILYPALMVGFSQLLSHQVAKMKSVQGRVMVLGPLPEILRDELGNAGSLSITKAVDGPSPPDHLPVEKPSDEQETEKPAGESTGESFSVPDHLQSWALGVIGSGLAEVVLVIPSNFPREVSAGRTGLVAVLADRTNERGEYTIRKVNDGLRRSRGRFMRMRLAEHPELAEGFTRPLLFTHTDLASPEKEGGYLAGRILPMLLILMVMLGAFYPAVDMTAGEKERGTMQTLLTAPAQPTEIIFGKFLAVFTVSILSAVVNLASGALAVWYLFYSSDLATRFSFSLQVSDVGLILAQLMPIALLFSALMLAVSVFARSYKEAQSYLTPVYLLVMIPVVLSGLPGTRLTYFSAWIPVLNVTLLIKELLVDPPEMMLLVQVMAANCIWCALALAAAVKIFHNEQVLLGGEGAFLDAFRNTEGDHPEPRPPFALALFCAALVLNFYIGGVLQQWDMPRGLILSEFLILAVPAVILVHLFRFDYVRVFSLRPVPLDRKLLGILMMGISSWIVLGGLAGWLQNMILPEPEAHTELMRKAVGLSDGRYPLWIMIAAFALTPAICEEILFRGAVLSGLRNGLGKWQVILITSLCFGISHISIYRILPTALIGLVITVIVWETRSIFAGMLFHFLHNGLTLLVHKLNWFPRLVNPTRNDFAWLQFALFVSVFMAGVFFLLRRTHAPEQG